MKIVSLKALNINSLKGETEINFAKLTKENSLFAITGPTGSGKSTLLDIISCALYGRTARLKNPNDLMSRGSGEAYCEVEFEIKGKRYRSSWAQKRARKKHDGKFQTAKMELVDLEKKQVLALKSRDVPKEIEVLSGLDFERFSQSMMLAQGGFDAFLRADEKERSILLEKITGTQIYADLSIAVFERHRSLQQEMDGDLKLLDSIEFLDENLVKEKEKKLAHNIEEKKRTDLELAELNRALQWMQKLSELLLENKKYEEDFIQISKKKEEHKESFEKLSLANRALNISATFSSYTQLQETLQDEKNTILKLSSEIQTLGKERDEKEKEYTPLKKEFEDESSKFNHQKEKLKHARELYTQEKETQKRMSEQNISLKEKKENFQQTTQTLKNSLEKYDKIEKEIKSINVSLQESAQDAKLSQTLEVIAQTISNFKEEEQEHEKNLSTEKTLLQEQNILRPEIENRKKYIEILKEKKEQEQLIQNYEEDRKKLMEGNACPLCGSIQHPYTEASNSVYRDNISNEQIKSTKTTLQKEEKLFNQANLVLQKNIAQKEQITSTIKVKQPKIEEYKERIKKYFKEFGFELDTQRVDTQYQELLKRKDRYTETLESLKALELKFSNYELEKKESQTKASALDSEIKTVLKDLKALESRQSQLASKRIEILNVANLDIYETEISLKYEKLQKREQQTKEQLNQLFTKYQERSTYKKTLDEKVLEDEKRLKQLKSQLEELYRKNDFKNEQEFQSALLTHDAREALLTLCNTIERQYEQTQTLHLQSQNNLKRHQEEPLNNRPIQELEILQALLEQKRNALQENIGSDKKELEINRENALKYQDKIQLLREKKEAFKVWVKLNELIGSADGAKFKKFAQGITLDQLIHLANHHLDILSSRYALARNQEKLLELEIIDAYQGNVVRPVTTLSGGESFIVSLALALGLSELASQKISIDSLFLDEGFGTLDEESLESALNALNLLQSGGKMVGVISHVEALKERIPLQIKIIPNGDGSSLVQI